MMSWSVGFSYSDNYLVMERRPEGDRPICGCVFKEQAESLAADYNRSGDFTYFVRAIYEDNKIS